MRSRWCFVVLVPCVSLGCSEQAPRSVVCGPGTLEQDGVCIVAPSMVVADAGGDDRTTDGGDRTTDAADGSSASCKVPIAFFKDNDGDGFGGTETMSACETPGAGWVTTSGDCDDTDPLVNPNAKQFQRTPTKAGSFDFDCDGVETLDPSAKVDPVCGGAYPNCSNQEGFLPAGDGRTIGPGMNSHCGSTAYRSCHGVFSGGTSYCGMSTRVVPALACR